MRVCAQPGCPTLIPADTRGGRCVAHQRQADRARGSAAARGYGTAHRRLRASYQQRMNAGERFTCWRCETHDVDPSNWQLGHCDDDRTNYHGPECPAGNQATSGRTQCPHPSHANNSPRA